MQAKDVIRRIAIIATLVALAGAAMLPSGAADPPNAHKKAQQQAQQAARKAAEAQRRLQARQRRQAAHQQHIAQQRASRQQLERQRAAARQMRQHQLAAQRAEAARRHQQRIAALRYRQQTAQRRFVAHRSPNEEARDALMGQALQALQTARSDLQRGNHDYHGYRMKALSRTDEAISLIQRGLAWDRQHERH